VFHLKDIASASFLRVGINTGSLAPKMIISHSIDRHDFQFTEQIKRDIEHMHTQINQGTSTRHLFTDEPASGTGDTTSAHPARLSIVDMTQFALIYIVLEHIHIP